MKTFFIKYKIQIVILVIICIFGTVFGLIYKNLIEIRNDEKIMIEVYYKSKSTNSIRPEIKYIDKGSEEYLLEETINYFYSQPLDSDLELTTNNNTEIENIELLDDSSVNIYFSEDYNNMNEIDELYFRASFVWTLTGLDFINNVNFYVENEILVSDMNRNNVLINEIIVPEKIESKEETLYFVDENNMLVPEQRIIYVSASESEESGIVKAIIDGPSTENLSSSVPKDLILLDVTTERHTCFVNVSLESIMKSNFTDEEVELAIYSIVNSLTKMEEIDSVQFLVDSKKVEKIGNTDVSKPLIADETLVSNNY